MMLDSADGAEERTGLRYRYLMASDPAAPIVYLVHGRAGNREVMWAFRRSLPEVCTIIAPEAPLADPIGGYSWWLVEPGRNHQPEALGAADRLGAFIRSVESLHGLSPCLRLALGFSQGAGTLSVLTQREPLLFRGVGLLAGFVIRLPDALPAETLPEILMAHGSADEVVPIADARAGYVHLRERGFPVEFVEDPVGHKVGTSGMRRLREWAGSIVGRPRLR